jgi:predicted DNA-binding transcriptional regulator YafY
VAHSSDHTDFEFDIRPTNDFINKLLSYGESLEVLEPADLRLKIRQKLEESLRKY